MEGRTVVSAICLERDAPLVVEEIELLPPSGRDVVVRVDACGICHSDLSVITGVYPLPLPALLGHEVSGVVEWVGEQVQRVAVGDRVVLASGPVCGECPYCERGQQHLCVLNWRISGTPRARLADGREASAIAGVGGFADVVVVDQASVIPVQTDLPAEELAILGCGVSVGIGAVVNTASVRPGDTVAVIGCGGVGLAVVAGAKLAGASRIVVIEPQAPKRATAERFGATDVVDPTGIDPVEAVQGLTGGGVDVSFEAVGVAETMLQAFRMARQGGEVVVVGFGGSDSIIEISAGEFFMGGKNLRPSLGSGGNNRVFYPQLIRLAESGRLDLAAFVTGRHKLAEVNDALDRVRAGDAIRDVLVF